MTTYEMPAEEQEFSADGVGMDSPFDNSSDSFTDAAPEDQSYNDQYVENTGEYNSDNNVFYDKTPVEDQMFDDNNDFSSGDSDFPDNSGSDNAFNMDNDSFSDTAPEDQGFDDAYAKRATRTARKRGDGASNDVFYDKTPAEDQMFDDNNDFSSKPDTDSAFNMNDMSGSENSDDGFGDAFSDDTPVEDQSFADGKKQSKRKLPWQFYRKHGKKSDSNGPEDQMFDDTSVTAEHPRIYRPIDRNQPVDDTYQDVLIGTTMGQDYDNDTIPYSVDNNDMLTQDDYDIDFNVTSNEGYGSSERLNNLRSSIRESMNSSPIEDQYLSGSARSPRIYRPVERRGRTIDDTYQDVLVGETMGQDYDNDTLPYSVDQNVDLSRRDYDIDFNTTRTGGIRSDRVRDLRNSIRENLNASPEDQYLEYGNKYPDIYEDDINKEGYPVNDTYTDVLFGPILGQDYDNDGVPYAIESSGYVSADQYDIEDRSMADNYNMDSMEYSPNRYDMMDDSGYDDYNMDSMEYSSSGYDMSNNPRYNKYNLDRMRVSSGVPMEDQYLSDASIRPPEIHQDPMYPRSTPINNTYNDVVYGDTLGQDYDDDGVPYALETERDLTIEDYDIDFNRRADIKSERLRELRSEIRDSMNQSGLPEDQYLSDRSMMAASDNPFDATDTDSTMRPSIYKYKDKSEYPEDDTIADVVFGDTLGQDYDNDGVPYALETANQMDTDYSDVFNVDNNDKYSRDKYMMNKYDSKYSDDKNIMDDNYSSVFEGGSRETAVNNIRRNLGNRFRDSTNDSIASEIARNRLSRRMERTDSAERAAERAKILEDARSVGRGRGMFSGRKGSRSRVDDYVMGDYEPSPVASSSYDSEGSMLNNGVAARAMREAGMR